MAAADSLTAERLRELFHYDPLTGVFSRRVRRGNQPVGAVAGYLRPDGYFTIRFSGRHYRVNRLAWLYMTGEWPPHLIDHEDRNPMNNRWANLRHATHSQNHQNQVAHKDNKCGFLGVELHEHGLWRARLTVRGKRIHLGYFKTPEEAAEARRQGERTYFTHSPTCKPDAKAA